MHANISTFVLSLFPSSSQDLILTLSCLTVNSLTWWSRLKKSISGCFVTCHQYLSYSPQSLLYLRDHWSFSNPPLSITLTEYSYSPVCHQDLQQCNLANDCSQCLRFIVLLYILDAIRNIHRANVHQAH